MRQIQRQKSSLKFGAKPNLRLLHQDPSQQNFQQIHLCDAHLQVMLSTILSMTKPVTSHSIKMTSSGWQAKMRLTKLKISSLFKMTSPIRKFHQPVLSNLHFSKKLNSIQKWIANHLTTIHLSPLVIQSNPILIHIWSSLWIQIFFIFWPKVLRKVGSHILSHIYRHHLVIFQFVFFADFFYQLWH